MANRHIKVINGRKYYYESIRKGKKVTSRYLGPVGERKRKLREAQQPQELVLEEQEIRPEENYIG
ncbi:MAG: hypothetical protein HY514_02905 [Candidatus Aenigmarchaeota archaeon]|nr:hypothetical protein [Candidatus Aenigmarchaeota archaeon]